MLSNKNNMTQKLQALSGIILLILVSVQTKAQSVFRQGFYVNEVNDTVRGLIKAKGKVNAPVSFVFKKDNEAAEEELSAEKIPAVVISSYRYYRSIAIGDGNYFAQALAEGKASLYLRDKEFYLKQQNEKPQLLAIEEVKTGTTIHRKMLPHHLI
jgi:hypothetical protein